MADIYFKEHSSNTIYTNIYNLSLVRPGYEFHALIYQPSWDDITHSS